MRDQADSAAVSDFDASSSEDSPATKRLRWWPLVVLAIVSWGFASWLVFIWLGIRTRTRKWFVVAGISAASVGVAFFVAAGTGPNSASSSVAACVSVANWVGATICVLVVRRRWLRPPELAEPVRWKTFYFPGSIDIAWEELTTALAPLGDTVTSEDFHTLLIKPQSRLVDVEFHMTLFPGATDATSALEVSRRHHWCFPFSGGRSSGWESLADLSRKTESVVVQLGFMRLPPPPPLQDVASVLRTVEFRVALKGYNVLQVDEFLDSLAAKIDTGEEVFAEDVLFNEFRVSWKGYNKQEVDEFLERLAAAEGRR